MKSKLNNLYFLLLVACWCVPSLADQAPVAFAIHGGAGTILRSEMTPDQETRFRVMLATAVRAGHQVLLDDGLAGDVTHETPPGKRASKSAARARAMS